MRDGQRGAMTIIEATFVFPIMFIIIFIMIMAGEAYLQYARVERACVTAAIRGAARCENPMLEVVQRTGEVPTGTTDAKVRPYRYILTSEAQSIAAEVADDLETEIEGFDVLVFRGTDPKNIEVKTEADLNILVSSFNVQCDFKVELPIRMLFEDENVAFKYHVQMSEPIGDPAEFVRNVSTVQDILERSEKVQGLASTIMEKLDVIAEFLN